MISHSCCDAEDRLDDGGGGGGGGVGKTST